MWVNAFLNKALKRWILLIANKYFRIMEGYVLNLCCLIFFAGIYALFDCKA
jgi:hypothetical protein